MGEHVGDAEYPPSPGSCTTPCGRRAGCWSRMSRGADAPGGGAFIESYIAPDMHMRPVGETVDC
ncbi:Cyclopropane-fatty-acyl-phospholipid synthase OS=Streptomyces microflavus OX=1919 GN=cfa PE=3 SV=1 [Streptomyces microflavus]